MIDRTAFVDRFGGVFEHSPWVAERALEAGVSRPLTVQSLHTAMVEAFRAADYAEKLQVLRAHPDLAGRLAIAGELTASSKAEQASAGLDRLSVAEHTRFLALNALYIQRFGFPFIIAVRGLDKNDIIAAFESRIGSTPEQEFATACAEVEKIARLRLDSLLPGETYDSH